MKEIEKEKFGGVVGDKGFEYYYIAALATAPKHQGHGYGSALVNTILFAVRIPMAEMSSFPNIIFTGGLERARDLPILEHTGQYSFLRVVWI